ncbi:MAG: mannan-binding lectin [Lachnospiraceae bacterium]|jgi:hypothetical protein|nr:mannan-binding lectin [Lachnospiraceae bacterium]MBR3469408.1 mannan-binding lectin [Lachnospiraceae bacterium]MBR4605201.1 mannan-binding lectin [Lachnospiraceae bacterium]MCR5500799.1 mannan-binding lectin [Acetatifactor sp.]
MAKFTIDIPAGPIWNQADAEKKCPMVCAAHFGTWNGQWKTVVEGKMSVCGCEIDTDRQGTKELILNVIAGPIWNQDDAKEKCPVVCASYGGEWTGGWHTPEETWGKMSVCECKFMI